MSVIEIINLLTALVAIIVGLTNWWFSRKKTPAEIENIQEETLNKQLDRIKKLNDENSQLQEGHTKEVALYKEEIRELKEEVADLNQRMSDMQEENRCEKAAYREYILTLLRGIRILSGQIQVATGEEPKWTPPDPPFPIKP